MNDRDVAHDPDLDVVGFEIRDLHRRRGVPQECFPVQERSVGLGAEKVVGQDFCKARNIGGFDRSNVIAVEVEETVHSGLQAGLLCMGFSFSTDTGALRLGHASRADHQSIFSGKNSATRSW